PFARERYWIKTEAAKPAMGGGRLASGQVAAVLHPLLHSNTSNLSEQRYSSTFTGEEFFLANHHVAPDEPGNEKTLPGVACCEMARAGIEQAWPRRMEATVLELRNTVWAQPIVVGGNRQISLALLANEQEQIEYEIYSLDGD